ncbi:hypothetical protein B0H14DRAFT_3654623 [Mycena olivaceomarginata]|nr:hypothetical protein B0H14DRAFT_3654623 [Mycena olivaceomarginata]
MPPTLTAALLAAATLAGAASIDFLHATPANRTAGCGTSHWFNGITQYHFLQSGTRSRDYSIHIPSSYDAKKLYPLVLGFHKKILVYPNGVGGAWAAASYSEPTVPQDLQFVWDLLDQIRAGWFRLAPAHVKKATTTELSIFTSSPMSATNIKASPLKPPHAQRPPNGPSDQRISNQLLKDANLSQCGPHPTPALVRFHTDNGADEVRGIDVILPDARNHDSSGTGGEIYDLSTICSTGNGNEVRHIMDDDWTWYFYWTVYYWLH